jgi:hypothetical protein
MAENDAPVDMTEFDGYEFVTVSSGGPKEVSKVDNDSEGKGNDEELQADAEEGSEESASEESGKENEEVDDEEESDKDSSSDLEEDDEADKIAEEVKAKRDANTPKPIKAKKGDEVLELDPNTTFDVKVDGQIQTVSLAKMRDSYASSQATHKEYRKFENEKRGWQSQVQEFNGVIDNFTKKVKEGEAIPAVMELISATGADALKTIHTIREAIIEGARELIEMTPEQRKLIYEREELDWIKQQNQKLVHAQTTVKQRQELEGKISQVIQAYQIPDRETFDETVGAVQEHAKKVGRGDVQVTPELVGQYYQASVLKQHFEQAIVEEGLSIAEGSEDYNHLADAIAKMKPSKEKIREVLRKLYKTGGSSNRRTKPEEQSSDKSGGKKANRADKLVDVDPGLDIDATPNVTDWKSVLRVA